MTSFSGAECRVLNKVNYFGRFINNSIVNFHWQIDKMRKVIELLKMYVVMMLFCIWMKVNICTKPLRSKPSEVVLRIIFSFSSYYLRSTETVAESVFSNRFRCYCWTQSRPLFCWEKVFEKTLTWKSASCAVGHEHEYNVLSLNRIHCYWYKASYQCCEGWWSFPLN